MCAVLYEMQTEIGGFLFQISSVILCMESKHLILKGSLPPYSFGRYGNGSDQICQDISFPLTPCFVSVKLKRGKWNNRKIYTFPYITSVQEDRQLQMGEKRVFILK